MTDWKALCAELVKAMDAYDPSDRIATGLNLMSTLDRARATLAQPEPEGRPAPAPAEAGGYDKDVRRMCEIILGNTFGNEELDSLALLVGHHPDVLNASPVPAPAPAEGEVADETRYLVKELRDQADDLSPSLELFGLIHRAADLLEQRHPAPVPMSERLPGPEDCDAEGRCWWFSPADPSAGTFGVAACWVLRKPEPEDDFRTHWLPATALPLPQGEVQP